MCENGVGEGQRLSVSLALETVFTFPMLAGVGQQWAASRSQTDCTTRCTLFDCVDCKRGTPGHSIAEDGGPGKGSIFGHFSNANLIFPL